MKCNPTENMTILIFDPVEPEEYPMIAGRIMQENHLHAEQVGFVKPPATEVSGVDSVLEMMGGEFCANATRSLAAALAFRKKPGKETGNKKEHDLREYLLAVSGVQEPIFCRVTATHHEGVYRSAARIPLPLAVETLTFLWEDQLLTGTLVTFPGIAHLVFQTKVDDPEGFFPLVLEQLKDRHHEALGMMFYEPHDSHMKPLVWVGATDTLIWERGCGSGTAAVGVALAVETRQTIRKTIFQPGGSLEIAVEWENGVKQIELDGEVAVVATGTLLLSE
ncbi:hypothetical protein [Anoxynatronum sibiricum]|uniref:hypothetical protein n=1 Tax=Anoxynatronum sibiricum TaxID=210623 RepID=UPI0031B82202